MRIFRTIFSTCIATALAAALVATTGGSAVAAAPTLAAVKKRGEVICGINGELPGFSAPDEKNEMAGIAVDLCRAIAAATLGNAAKVKLVPVTTTNRFDMLRSGNLDLLFRNTIPTLERVVKTGVRDAAIYYLDGQAVAVPKRLGIASLAQLGGRRFCILSNTPYERNLRDWFRFRKLEFTTVVLDNQKDLYAAFFDGKCDAVTQQVTSLSTTIIASGKASEYIVLPEIVANNPHAAFVRAGDDEWFDVVRWSINALMDAEQRGITQANVDSQIQTGADSVKRLLGAPSDDGKLLGLDGRWAYNEIKQVGNYSEIFERNLGQSSRWKFPRGVNALWTNGGVLHSLPLR